MIKFVDIYIVISLFLSSFTISLKFVSLKTVKKSIIIPNASVLSPDNVILSNNKKLEWKPEGYKQWNWRGYKINYIESGSSKNPPLFLIHGFGASAFHWRYNIPALSEKYHVFAFDMLGFGLSDKPIITYSSELWRDQALDFIENVIKSVNNKACVIAGNSLGGFTALYAASTKEAIDKNLIKACILVNAAGSFKSQVTPKKSESETPKWLSSIQSAIQRFIIGLSFVYTKQPMRIAQVLRQVYPADPTNVDDELVESIRFPAQDPNAAEVFYRVIKKTSASTTYVDELIEKLKAVKMPLLLAWGELDPWIRPVYADMIQKIYPECERVNINAGHCPHDEAPESVNAAIISFMDKL